MRDRGSGAIRRRTGRYRADAAAGVATLAYGAVLNRVLPEVVRRLRDRALDVTLDIVGPVVGRPGDEERTEILADAARLGIGTCVRTLGSVPLDRLLPMYRDYDIFVLPTLLGSQT